MSEAGGKKVIEIKRLSLTAQVEQMRITYLDTTKGILVLAMVMAHVIQFFGAADPLMKLFSDSTNLMAFSGFLFCFGYGSYLAYLRKENIPKSRMLRNSLRILIAYYISGTCYKFFVDRSIDMSGIIKLLLLSDIAGYSEVLVSFFIIILLSVVFAKQFRMIVTNNVCLAIAITVSLSFTCIPYSLIKIPQVGLLLGTTDFPSFPVFQYLPLFLVGSYFAFKSIRFNWIFVLTSVFLLIEFATYSLLRGHLPFRSPPSAMWIAGSFGPVYACYALGYFLDRIPVVAGVLRAIGANVLYWFVTSNIAIFSLTLMVKKNSLAIPGVIIVYIVIVTIIYYVATIIRMPIVAGPPLTRRLCHTHAHAGSGPKAGIG